jgi:hypothetical protein
MAVEWLTWPLFDLLFLPLCGIIGVKRWGNRRHYRKAEALTGIWLHLAGFLPELMAR